MVPEPAVSRSRSESRRSLHAVDDAHPSARSEDLHVRSYAHEWAYDLHVEIATPDGDVVFRTEYYLQPGDTESEVNALAAGEYEVRATLDDDKRRTLRCRIESSPDRTAVIEVGNGVLSLTEGLPVR